MGCPLSGSGTRYDRTLAAIDDAIGDRRLVWFGIRGDDAASLLEVRQFASCFSLIAPLQSGSIGQESAVAFEDLAGYRPDLDRYDVDLDLSDDAAEFKRQFLAEVSTRCVVATYRPTVFISSFAFSMRDTMTLAGLFKDRQLAFEHKPWVETSLAQRDVTTLGWTYVSDEHHARAKRLLRQGPLVLRASRASGGVGLVRVDTEAEIDEHWPKQADEFVAVAPYLEDATPLNLSGSVFRDGSVRLHPASVQLIGIELCTDRPFGYCGNDFGAAAALDDDVLDALDALGRVVGKWLHEERYVGAFGVDALLHEGEIRFTEVNPRFQGSSALSAEIAAEVGEPDLFLDHLAASLGATGDSGVTLREWGLMADVRSHIVVHNTSPDPVVRQERPMIQPANRDLRITLLPPPGLKIDPGATMFRLVLRRATTSTGFDIDQAMRETIQALAAQFEPWPQTELAVTADG